jgi:signal transduction histidine kinase/CHASE3 domain sensor protein
MVITRSRISISYIIVIVALLTLISVSSFWASLHMEAQSNSIVQDAIPLSQASNRLLTDLVNQETGVRGYVISGDSQFLEPYQEGTAQLSKDLAVIASYQDRHDGLRLIMEREALPIIKSLQTDYTSLMGLVRSGQGGEARNQLSRSKQLMDQFRTIHTLIDREISRISEEAYDRSASAGQSSRLIISIGGILALLIGILTILVFRRARIADTELAKSEEKYRHIAESLESQNEEIIAQQAEQEQTLQKLSERERDLEAISSYQQQLTGHLDIKLFVSRAVPALLDSLKLDAALVVLKQSSDNAPRCEVLYASGYPSCLPYALEQELFGPALRVLQEKRPIESLRVLTDKERGFHLGATRALDKYFPLCNDKQEPVGFLLLTSYYTMTISEQQARLTKWLIDQFSLAFLAQLMNEERRKQAANLSELNELLLLEKRHIEEQRDLIENILDSTHEGMTMCDSQGTLLFANDRMKDYLPLHEHIGSNLLDIVRQASDRLPSLKAVFHLMERLLDGVLEQLQERMVIPGEDNTLRHIELYATRVGDNTQEQGYLFVFRDRTEEEKIDEMKNEFISIVSHELRTPLTSILGFVEIMLNRTLAPERQHKYIQTIHSEAMRLSALINDFLDLQRMESGRQMYQFTPLNLISLVQEAAAQWEGKPSHQIKLHLPDADAWVRGDKDRLKQMLLNLLSNAIKYSPQADTIDVRVDVQAKSVRVEIEDYGLGIPEEARAHLFTKFYRVDNSDRRQIGGTGLGLAIVKEIADSHGGTVTYRSVMGEGTVFTVELNRYDLIEVEVLPH